MTNAELEKLVLEQKQKGNIVFDTVEGVRACKLSDFIDQPSSGILYDLNRDELSTLAGKDINLRWINDYAVSQTIHALKAKIDELTN